MELVIVVHRTGDENRIFGVVADLHIERGIINRGVETDLAVSRGLQVIMALFDFEAGIQRAVIEERRRLADAAAVFVVGQASVDPGTCRKPAVGSAGAVADALMIGENRARLDDRAVELAQREAHVALGVVAVVAVVIGIAHHSEMAEQFFVSPLALDGIDGDRNRRLLAVSVVLHQREQRRRFINLTAVFAVLIAELERLEIEGDLVGIHRLEVDFFRELGELRADAFERERRGDFAGKAFVFDQAAV